MLRINSIDNGVIIDHIHVGLGLKIFKYLGLDKADYSVALIMNASSAKLERKDLIKIENKVDLDYTVLGLIDPNITVDIIENGAIKEKVKLALPQKVENVIKCKNPRCITSIEKYIPHIFHLVDKDRGEYRCTYCDEIYSVSEIRE
ncbi:MAG TPA: aspartate carbamoyltransferase regulatory subunit [Clostridiaceae bacterium]|nr:aspartate carbamoyltransferase regulatory subunit [Clostridiaceae bacterium]